jgi:hypothetical protein
MLSCLMIAEKPSLAESIAKMLAPDKNNLHSRKGISPACRVHEYTSFLFGKETFFKVTSVTGILFYKVFINFLLIFYKI